MKREARSGVNFQELKRVKVLSAGKFFAVLGFIFGILEGILAVIASYGEPVSFANAMTAFAQNPQQGFMYFLVALRWFALIVSPLFFAIAYFVNGVVLAFVYNVIAKMIGGIKVLIE